MPQNEIERERSRQALMTCFRCRRLFPLDVLQEGDRLVIQPGPIVYDEQDGFICTQCAGDPLGDPEDRREPEAVRESILDVLFTERQGLSVQELSTFTGETTGVINYYLMKLLQDGQVRRDRPKGLRHDLYFIVDDLDDKNET